LFHGCAPQLHLDNAHRLAPVLPSNPLHPQGARLVAAPAGGHAALLQMPRGNLEGVYPRLLVLAAVLGALRGGAYRAAWRLAAAQRVDLNLLVDDRWPAFLSEAPAFVEVGVGPWWGAGLPR
jgi:hypothetical protein